MYEFLDKFFLIFHSSLIIFNLFGWVWKKTRKINLASLVLTAISWLVLGIWRGIGYCPLTDWHWQILRKLGRETSHHSYVQYLIDRVTGLDIGARSADVLTVTMFALAFAASIYTNAKQMRANRTEP